MPRLIGGPADGREVNYTSVQLFIPKLGKFPEWEEPDSRANYFLYQRNDNDDYLYIGPVDSRLIPREAST